MVDSNYKVRFSRRAHKTYRHCETGETVDRKGCWESPIGNLHLLVTQGLLSRACTYMMGLVSVNIPTGLLAGKK